LKSAVTPVFNLNYLDTRETGIVNVRRAAEGTTRYDSFKSLQELFVEYTSAISARITTSFLPARGSNPSPATFAASSSARSARVPPVRQPRSNRYQYNAAYFRPLEKDTNSGLNRLFDTRSQHVGIVNYFVQDFICRATPSCSTCTSSTTAATSTSIRTGS